MQLLPATPAHLPFVRKVYESSFPRAERKPLAVIQKNVSSGFMELLIIEQNGQPAGIAITAVSNALVLLDYFAMEEHCRGGGLGTTALRALLARYDGRDFFLEIESVEVPCDNLAQRQSRKSFYLRNGLYDTGHRIRLFGIDMEILSSSPTLLYAGCEQLYRQLYGKHYQQKVQYLNPSTPNA